jgi:hypothetical protein
MKLLIMQFVQVILRFLPLWTKCLPQLPSLEHNPPIFFHTLKVRNLNIITDNFTRVVTKKRHLTHVMQGGVPGSRNCEAKVSQKCPTTGQTDKRRYIVKHFNVQLMHTTLKT